MGAIIATCLLFSKIWSEQKAATIVFPDPTSPCTSLCIGLVDEISSAISFITRVCALVILKFKLFKKIPSDSKSRNMDLDV